MLYDLFYFRIFLSGIFLFFSLNIAFSINLEKNGYILDSLKLEESANNFLYCDKGTISIGISSKPIHRNEISSDIGNYYKQKEDAAVIAEIEEYNSMDPDKGFSMNNITVENTKVFPFSAVCHVVGIFRDGNNTSQFYASGILVDPKHMLLSAHQIFDWQDGLGFMEELTIFPAAKGYDYPYGIANVNFNMENVLVFSQWQYNRNYDFDIALVKLDRPVGALTGWLTMAVNNDNFFLNNSFNMSSYPNEGPHSENHSSNLYMFYQYGSFDSVEGAATLKNNHALYGGQSGAGVYCDQNKVYGVASHQLKNVFSTTAYYTRLTETTKNAFNARILEGTPTTYDLMPLKVSVGSGSLVEVSENRQFDEFSFYVHNYSTQEWNGAFEYSVFFSSNATGAESSRVYLDTYEWSGRIGPKETVKIEPGSPPRLPANHYLYLSPSLYLGVSLMTNDADNSNNYTKFESDFAKFKVTGEVISSLSNGSVNPSSGTNLDNYIFSVTYTGVSAPTTNSVKVVINGTAHTMTASGSNWSDGVEFYKDFNGFTAGNHTYYFTATVDNKSLRFPTAPETRQFNVTQNTEGWDASVTEIFTNPSGSFSQSTDLRISGKIKNNSNHGNTYYNLPVKLELINPSGIPIHSESISIPMLTAGSTIDVASQSIPISSSAPDGMYQATVTISPSVDSDPANNSRSVSIFKGSAGSTTQYHIQHSNSLITLKRFDEHQFAGSTYELQYINSKENAVFFVNGVQSSKTIYYKDFDYFDNNNTILSFFDNSTEQNNTGQFSFGQRNPTIVSYEEIIQFGYPGDRVHFTINSNQTFSARRPDFYGSARVKLDQWYSHYIRGNSNKEIKLYFDIPANESIGERDFYLAVYLNNSNEHAFTHLRLRVLQRLPEVSSISSYLFSSGDEITITGTNFGPTKRDVEFGNLKGEVVSWTNTSIKCIVPTGVSDGQLKVRNSAGASNPINYSVLYRIELSANPSSGGTVSGSGKYPFNTPINAIATPGADWLFEYWEEDGNNVSEDQVYYFFVTSDRALKAVFSEKPQVFPPTVQTLNVHSVDDNSAVVEGEVTNSGGATVTERGIVYSMNQNPTTSNTKVTAGSGTGSFTANMSDLNPSTTYYVRAYAINSVDIAYGQQIEFTTASPPVTCITPGVPEDLIAIGTGETTADIYWFAGTPQGSPTVDYFWEVRNTIGTVIKNGNTPNLQTGVTELTAGTSYSFRVRARTSCDDSYSSWSGNSPFTTNPSQPGCIATNSFGQGITAPNDDAELLIVSGIYAGEYSMVNAVVTGKTYRFRSTNTSDYITITNSSNVILHAGQSPVSWTATYSGAVGVHVHTNSNCGIQSIERNLYVQCLNCVTGFITRVYSQGDIPTGFGNPWTGPSTCPEALSVTIPSGYAISGLDVSYTMTAVNFGWMSEQRSRIYSPTTGTGEQNYTSGVGGSAGTMTYQRNGLTFANGATGTVVFHMDAGRTWGSTSPNTGCNTYYNKVDNNSWVLKVYYEHASSVVPQNFSLQFGSVQTGQSECYNAINQISLPVYVSGEVTLPVVPGFSVENGGSLILVAGQSISLHPGMRVEPGGYLHAYITTTGTYCAPVAKEEHVEEPPEELVVGIEEGPLAQQEEIFFKVFPNPTTGSFTLELGDWLDAERVSVEVYNALGSSVLQTTLPPERQHVLSLAGQQPGIYVVRVIAGDRVGVERIVKR